MQRWITLAQAALALASCGLVAGASAAAGGDVVVIRGASVSVARPLTVERALDGRSEVEIVRVEVEPEPAAKPAPREPERELVVTVVPGEDPVPTWVGVPIVWSAPCPWAKWRGVPLPLPHRHDFRPAHGRLPPVFQPVGIHRGPVRGALRARSAQLAARGIGR